MMSAEKTREVTATDIQVLDQAIVEFEKFQTQLYVWRRVLGEIWRLDIGSVKRGVEAERDRLDDLHKQADAAQQQLGELGKQIADKQRALREVEQLIEQRTDELNRLNEGYQRLRAMLAAA